jgi:hypothetical protein
MNNRWKSLGAKFVLGICSCSMMADQLRAADTYSVVSVDSENIVLDGVLDDIAWQQANHLQDQFHFPWRVEDLPSTRFQAVRDGQHLYFSFAAEDDEQVVVVNVENELDIGGEDRVELFFASSALETPVSGESGCELPLYYGVEIDPLGRVLDFSARYYRRFDFDWDFPGLEVVAFNSQSHYQIEARIPLQALQDLNLISPENGLMVGVFRGEFSGSGDGLTSRWISWIDPSTPQPDFHVSEAFGYFQLIDN